jgi:hypothetical protein
MVIDKENPSVLMEPANSRELVSNSEGLNPSALHAGLHVCPLPARNILDQCDRKWPLNDGRCGALRLETHRRCPVYQAGEEGLPYTHLPAP